MCVAERDDGAIVGRLGLARETHRAGRHIADLCPIVAQDARREALMEPAREWALASGVRKLEPHVFPWNAPGSGCSSGSGSSVRVPKGALRLGRRGRAHDLDGVCRFLTSGRFGSSLDIGVMVLWLVAEVSER